MITAHATGVRMITASTDTGHLAKRPVSLVLLSEGMPKDEAFAHQARRQGM
jgi:hypothetical protein